jgi:tetratricopeptide (TPR) repeat protein
MVSLRAFPLILLLGFVAAVFASAPAPVFQYDDLADIANNSSAKADTFFARLPSTNRPLTKASYALNDWLHGPWPPGYWVINLFLHLAATLMVYLLVARAVRLAGHAREAPWVAALITVTWAVHPALTESVTYLSGRSMVLSGALMLAALLAATARRPLNVAAGAFSFLAVATRETALVLPAIVLWWQLTLGPSGRPAMRPALAVFLGTAAGASVIAMMPYHRELLAFSLQVRGPILALRDNIHAAFDILGFWFRPDRISISPAPPAPHAWSDPQTLLLVAAGLAAAVAALALRRRLKLAAFGIGLMLLALMPSNSVIWRLDPVALKPLYLAGLGITLIFAGLLLPIVSARIARAAIVAASLGLTGVLGWMANGRAALFADELALWADAAAKTPHQARALSNYGFALMDRGEYTEAEATLRRAADIAPHDIAVTNALEIIATLRGMD